MFCVMRVEVGEWGWSQGVSYRVVLPRPLPYGHRSTGGHGAYPSVRRCPVPRSLLYLKGVPTACWLVAPGVRRDSERQVPGQRVVDLMRLGWRETLDDGEGLTGRDGGSRLRTFPRVGWVGRVLSLRGVGVRMGTNVSVSFWDCKCPGTSTVSSYTCAFPRCVGPCGDRESRIVVLRRSWAVAERRIVGSGVVKSSHEYPTSEALG